MRCVLARTGELGINVPFNVLAATPQLRQRPDMWLTAVDPGRLLFGIQPDGDGVVHGKVFSALRALRSRLIQVKSSAETDLPEYGRVPTTGNRRYGVLPFGWTDVLLREPYERSGVLVRGQHVPFATALSAEHSVIDLTTVPDAQAGDIVTILGHDGEQSIDLDEVAKSAQLQASDMTRSLHRHLPYVYFRNGQPFRLKTPLQEVESPF
jgi:alanine racemase